MNTYSIYGLHDQNGNIFYIGQTNNPKRRLRRHLSEANNGNHLYVYNKMRKILRNNGSIGLVILKSDLDEISANNKEIEIISEFRKFGYRICNIADGGRFCMTPDMQKRAAEKRKGQKRSAESRKRMSEARLGMRFSSQHKKNLSKAWKRTPEQLKIHGEKCAKTSKGRINVGLFRCISPEGTEFITTHGLTLFCEEHSLTHANMIKVANGERPHHKGWKVERLNGSAANY